MHLARLRLPLQPLNWNTRSRLQFPNRQEPTDLLRHELRVASDERNARLGIPPRAHRDVSPVTSRHLRIIVSDRRRDCNHVHHAFDNERGFRKSVAGPSKVVHARDDTRSYGDKEGGDRHQSLSNTGGLGDGTYYPAVPREMATVSQQQLLQLKPVVVLMTDYRYQYQFREVRNIDWYVPSPVAR